MSDQIGQDWCHTSASMPDVPVPSDKPFLEPSASLQSVVPLNEGQRALGRILEFQRDVLECS